LSWEGLSVDILLLDLNTLSMRAHLPNMWPVMATRSRIDVVLLKYNSRCSSSGTGSSRTS
jgi:hypothetical protein